MQSTIYNCDGCGTPRTPNERGWLALERTQININTPTAVRLLVFDQSDPDTQKYKHYCGENCAIKAVNSFIQDLRQSQERGRRFTTELDSINLRVPVYDTANG